MTVKLIIILSFLSILIYLCINQINKCLMMNKYKNILDLFDYFLSKSYDVIYTDQLSAYILSGHIQIPDDELETIERNFINLSFQIMGKNNEKLFILFFGSRVSMIKNMILFIREKINNSEIAKMIQKQEIIGNA